jgi:predicted TIM-barrel fold metal-dependent hydrolase
MRSPNTRKRRGRPHESREFEQEETVQDAASDAWLISVDDHIVEPPNVWIDRLPRKYRDLAPRWVTDDKGSAWIVGEDDRSPIGASIVSGAITRPQERPEPFYPLSWEEIPAAAYDPKARVEAMNADRVLAAVLFGNLPGFDGNRFSQLPDKDFALLCLQAYNDWLLDEFCASQPGRFIGLALVPLWDARAAAAEAERAIRKGARAVSFSMAPHNLGFPSIWDPGRHWDPLFALMNEVGLPLCTHLGTDFNGDVLAAANSIMSKCGPGVGAVMMHLAGQVTLLEWLGSGNFERFPNLKVALSENGIGWIPAVLERADWVQKMARARVTIPADAENDPLLDQASQLQAREQIRIRSEQASTAQLPSELFRDHVYGCFIEDAAGAKHIELIGEDNVMIETDFPHNSTKWPRSLDAARALLSEAPERVRWKVLRGNAERLFDFKPAEPPTLTAA